MVLAESELSHRAAEESLPLRDAFAVLFFVSVGMLFDPETVISQPFAVLATLLIIMVGKSIAAFLIVKAFRHPVGTSMLIAASLGQIGEFSFILAELGVELQLLPEEGRDLIITGAIISIMLNPAMFLLADKLEARRSTREEGHQHPKAAAVLQPTALRDHAVLVGFGRVGKIVAQVLAERQQPFLVIEVDEARTAQAEALGIEVISGNAVLPEVLRAAGVPAGRSMLIAIPNGFEAGNIVLQAKALNPAITIVARAHSDAEVEHLTRHGADHVIMGEREIAQGLVDLAPQPSYEGGERPFPA
jgi:CPA2 family monovalent cation:H+ antiporter-2